MLIGFASGTVLVFSIFSLSIKAAGGTPKDIIISLGFIMAILAVTFVKQFISKWEIVVGCAHIEIKEQSKAEPKAFDFSNVKCMKTVWGGIIIYLQKMQYGTRRVPVQFMYVENGRKAKHELLINWKQFDQNKK